MLKKHEKIEKVDKFHFGVYNVFKATILKTVKRRTILNIQAIKKAVSSALKQSRYVRALNNPVNKSSVLICGNCENISIPSAIRNETMKNLCSCEYILTDDVLPEYFIKKPEQKVISFGKFTHNCSFDRARHSYLCSDYIVCENANEFAQTYQLHGVYTGLLLEDKNSVFAVLNGLVPDGKSVYDGEKRTIIYSGSLKQNGLTTSLLNLLSELDEDEVKKCCITFRSDSIDESSIDPEKLRRLVDILPIRGKSQFTLSELICYYLYFKRNSTGKFVKKRIDRLYKREWQRIFGCIPTECAVHFTGYEYGMINLFRSFEGRNVIYVHNNMPEEIKLRHNQHLLTLQNAYREFTTVALVTEDMRRSAMTISKTQGENFAVVPNCHDYRSVLTRADFPVEFQTETQSNVTAAELEAVLASDKMKLITIGRFSPEKAHMRLMKTFERFCDTYPQSVLIIIGGRGELYEETLEYANKSNAEIIVIKSMQNPMPVLKKCNLFMLPSRYEGLGLVLLEADTLGIPVFATDVEGPRGFMQENGGLLVPDTSGGILDGMMLFAGGSIPAMNIDYDVYNKKAADKFREVTGLKI
ncbi:MAG: glycosyltransferase [Ruminococcus sp.]|nr:glycosyltransferase [Ruminococcus sp.]